MTSVCHYENATEERLHLSAIQKLARDLNQREEDVQVLYEEILGGMSQRARIKNYLVILVSCKVRESIRSRALTVEFKAPRQNLSKPKPTESVLSTLPRLTA
jgi:hypothetical protein